MVFYKKSLIMGGKVENPDFDVEMNGEQALQYWKGKGGVGEALRSRFELNKANIIARNNKPV